MESDRAVIQLSKDFPNRLAVVHLQPLPAPHLQLAGIQTQELQDRRVNVGDVVPVLHGMEADVVGGTMYGSALDAGPGQPGTETLRVMIPAVSLGSRRA